jgi:predicted AAA+ superfamily ATPase
MLKRILSRQIGDTKKSILLLGPRQTGKTTLLKSLKPDLIVNLAKEREFQDHLTNPRLLEDQIELGRPQLVLVDEVQRIPSLLNTIQSIIDESNIRFLITGSSARKLKRGQANLLPGRVINRSLFPLTVSELNYQAKTELALKYGFLPGIVNEPDPTTKEDVLTSYVSNYLKEEIQQEALTRNLSGYSTFINCLSDWVGQDLDYSKISTKNKLNRFAVHRFFEILEDTLVGQRIQSYSFDDNIKTVKHPKFYFFDNGVMNGIHQQFSLNSLDVGRNTETVIYNQLLALLSYKNKPFNISFFRTHTGIEVDFIVEQGRDVFAIEVKSNEKLGSDDLRHLHWLKTKQPAIKTLLFHFGKRSFKLDNIWCLNWQEGLKEYFG